ncbi:MAG: hypothetical protein Q4D54_08670 [Eubacteriales bacterium]|nr:hypothetical protein [Eubacteriales bacterium]
MNITLVKPNISHKDAGLSSLQLSVEQTNEPSVKTIVKNGGQYV